MTSRPRSRAKPVQPAAQTAPPAPDALQALMASMTPQPPKPPETEQPEQPEDDGPTLGEVAAAALDQPSAPTSPGFVMSDDPIEPQIFDRSAATETVFDPAHALPAPETPLPPPVPATPKRKTPAARKPAAMQYVSRIQVTEAYRFDGQVAKAPEWISREWHGYDDGVVLMVPNVGMARVGDYIVQQEVLMDHEGDTESKLAIYTPDEFERMFLPRT